jgi:hypothetical protein
MSLGNGLENMWLMPIPLGIPFPLVNAQDEVSGYQVRESCESYSMVDSFLN